MGGSDAGSQERERLAKVGYRVVRRRMLSLGGARSEEDPQAEPRRRTCFDVAHLVAQNRTVSGVPHGIYRIDFARCRCNRR
jgi:hypothetical protein